MSLRSELQSALAAAALEAARAVGVQVVYWAESAVSGTTIWVVPIGVEEEDGEYAGIETRERSWPLMIPKQTGFPPTNGVLKDQIVYGSRTYEVSRAVPDSVEAKWRIDARKIEGRRPGIG